MSGIAGTQKNIGEPYIDNDNVEYLSMSQQPVMIHSSTKEKMNQLLKKGLNKDVVITIYTEELFTTYNDSDNRASVEEFPTDKLNLVGIGMRGKKIMLINFLKGLTYINSYL